MARNKRRISIDDLDRFSIDDDRNLYWDDQPVEVRRTLTGWQSIGAVAVVVAAVASALADWIQVFRG